MARRLSVGIDDLLGADFIGILIECEILVGHKRRGVVDAADFAFLADFDFRDDRMNARRRMVDVRDRAGRRHRLEIAVIEPVAHHVVAKLTPHFRRRQRNARARKQFSDPRGAGRPCLRDVFVKILAARVTGRLKAFETFAALARQHHGGVQRVPGDGIKIEIGEIEPFRRAIGDAFAGQIAMQIHLPKPDGVRGGVARFDGRHAADMAHVRDRRQRAHGGFHCPAKIRRIHGMRDIQRAEIAGDIMPCGRVVEVFIKRGGAVDLQNLRAQVAHVDAPGNRVGAVHRVFKHDVRIAGFKLNLRQALEQLARADVALADTLIFHQLCVHLADADIAERLAVNTLHVVGRKERHLRVGFRQFKRDIGDHHAERERFDTDFLIGVFAFGIQKTQDIGVVRVQIDRARALARAELVGVRKGVFQHFHYRDHAGGLIFDALNRRARFPEI
ncbi:hypothetical protein BN132_1510 [Cronobacter turicensis 564]|nr:hypothetical protein BN132_1510 [Cronobacter turicensis 564]